MNKNSKIETMSADISHFFLVAVALLEDAISSWDK